jgi:hypothetical protein
MENLLGPMRTRKSSCPSNRPTYVLTLRPEPGVDGLRALRRALKVLLRTFGLRCVTIRRAEKKTTSGGWAGSQRHRFAAVCCPMQNEDRTPKSQQARWSERHRAGLAHRLDRIADDVAELKALVVQMAQQQPPPAKRQEAPRR